MIDDTACEVEVLDFLKALVRLHKPECILETGTYKGHSANAMAEACDENDLGVVITCDPNPQFETLHPRVKFHPTSSLDLMVSHPIDLLFLDSSPALRAKELERFSYLLTQRHLIVVHDTGATHPELRQDIRTLVDENVLEGVFLPTPRGLFVGQLTRLPYR